MADEHRPSIIILAGPNGAGKSTSAPFVLQRTLGVHEFVNADVIARELSPDDVDRAAIAAGRVMLTRLRDLARRRVSFAFETTLSSRSFAPWLSSLRVSGYDVDVQFFWLPSAEFAIERVAQRSGTGGHSVPAEVVRRRHRAGIRNFFSLYEPIATTWTLYDASGQQPVVVAERVGIEPRKVYDGAIWAQVTESGTT